MKKIGFFLWILLNVIITRSSYSQFGKINGIPFIQYYNDKDFNSELQIWSIVQDKRGVLYFGNNNGILEYDGSSWRLIKVTNASSVRSLAIDSNGVVYVGATREFGYLAPDSLGKMKYLSLSKKLIETRFEAVWKICINQNGVYFVAGRQFIYKYSDQKLSQLPSTSLITEMRAFIIENQIYVSDINLGFGKIINDTIKFLNAGYDVSKKVVYSMLPFGENKILIGTRKDGLYIFNSDIKNSLTFPINVSRIKKKNGLIVSESENEDNTTIPFNCEFNDFLKKNQIYSGANLTDGNHVITTMLGGFIIFNDQGKMINIFNIPNGFIDNAVYSVFEDRDRNIWLGMEKGIAHVEICSPFTLYNNSNGLDGTILSNYIYDNRLFVGTTTGVFYLESNGKNLESQQNVFLPLTKDHIFNLDFLAVGTAEGSKGILLISSLREILYMINLSRVKEIKKVYGCYNLCPSIRVDGRIFLGHSNGISSIRITFNNGEPDFIDEGDLINVKENSSNLINDSKGDLWLATAFNGLAYIKFEDDENINEFEVYKFDTTSGLPEMSNNYILNVNDKILVATSRGLYKLVIPPGSEKDPSSFSFVPEKAYGLDFSLDSTSVSKLYKDNRQNLWMITNHGICKFDMMTNQLEVIPFKRIKDAKIDNLYIDNQGNGWFCNNDNLFRLDAKRKTEIRLDFTTLLRKVTIGKDSIIYYGTPYRFDTSYIKHQGKIIFRYNSVTFEFASPTFNQESDTRFQYYLEGFDPEWSYWKMETKAVYTNLPPGKYKFHVRAKNIYDIQGKEAIYEFVVGAPWYLTAYALVLYIVLSILLVIIIIQLNTRRLKAEKEKLQELIKTAINKVEQQKEELRTQTERLAQTNTELEKLSIVARETDNAVVILDPRGNYEWINEGFTRIYGYTLEQLIHDKARSFIGVSTNLNIKDLVNVWFGDKKPIIYEAMTHTRDGRQIWAQTTLTPIVDENGRVVRLIAIDTDITKIKKAEAEIQMQRDEIRKQRDIALQQRDEISLQKKEITDSLHYAKRIQRAILPSETVFNSLLKEFFIFYLPKDIVSGDFYWIAEKNQKIVLAAADCTGHGVPGALMSMIGVTFLNEIVNDREVLDPSQILNILRENIISSLRQTEETPETQDGMDISLCVIDLKQSILEYSGANHPLIIIKSNKQFIEIKPDKMPISIGGYGEMSFSKTRVELQNGDAVYLFTDGYLDQFGGENEKKFKLSNFKNLLLNIHELPMNIQKEHLQVEIDKWKGPLSQVDDILVMGYRYIS